MHCVLLSDSESKKYQHTFVRPDLDSNEKQLEGASAHKVAGNCTCVLPDTLSGFVIMILHN
jgi:hypothetical protein